MTFAHAPQLKYVLEQEALPKEILQTFDLWVTGTGPWSLLARAPDGLMFVNEEKSLVSAGVLYSGENKHQSSIDLKVKLAPALDIGKHNLNLALTLEEAQGILGLPLPPDYWIMPLNNHQTWVLRDGLKQEVLPGQWFLLAAEDSLFYGEEAVYLQQGQIETLNLASEANLKSVLSWDTPNLDLQAGDEAIISLKLHGPQNASTLVLKMAECLHINSAWSLSGRPIQTHIQGQSIILNLPQLPPGEHILEGKLLALLPTAEKNSQLKAYWQGQVAELEILIERDWFDHNGIQLIQVESPDSYTSVLMPDGRRRSVRARTALPVQGGRLNLLLPLVNPTEPIWTGLPLAESVLWSLENPAQGREELEFFVPILLWDQSWSWRLLARNQHWILDTSPLGQYFQGQFGAFRVTNSAGRLSFSTDLNSSTEGAWHWQETPELRRITWQQEPWLWSLKLPRDATKNPQLRARYRGENWQIQVSPHKALLQFSKAGWTLGTSYSPNSSVFWLQGEQGLSLELSSQRLYLAYEASEGKKMNLQVKANKEVQIGLRHASFEAYLKNSPDSSQLGLRFKQPKNKGRWLFLTKGAAEIKNRFLIWELDQQLGYSAAPWCTFYVQAMLRGSAGRSDITPMLDLSYEAGAVFTPAPQVVASLGWHSKHGWQCKAGLVIPFVGRKTTTGSE